MCFTNGLKLWRHFKPLISHRKQLDNVIYQGFEIGTLVSELAFRSARVGFVTNV